MNFQLATKLALVMLMACPLGNLALADTYKWVDKKGVVHFTDNPDELPEPQRSKVLDELERKSKAHKKQQATQPTYEPIPPEARKERLPPAQSTGQHGHTGGQVFATPSTNNATSKPIVKDDKVDPTSSSQRKAWADKATRARKKVTEIEKECEKLLRMKDEASRKGLIFATPKARQETVSLTEDLKTCRQNLQKAKQYRDEVLPEEARRAGVPPGWIR